MAVLRTQPVIDNPAIVKVAATLPAVGAWDVPIELAPAGFNWVTLYFTYTRGAAGGAVDYQVQTSPYAADQVGVDDWFPQSAYAVGAVVAGVDTASAIQREIVIYGSTAAGAETWTFGPIYLEGTVERIRVYTRESGATDDPGDCHIIGMFYN